MVIIGVGLEIYPEFHRKWGVVVAKPAVTFGSKCVEILHETKRHQIAFPRIDSFYIVLQNAVAFNWPDIGPKLDLLIRGDWDVVKRYGVRHGRDFGKLISRSHYHASDLSFNESCRGYTRVGDKPVEFGGLLQREVIRPDVEPCPFSQNLSLNLPLYGLQSSIRKGNSNDTHNEQQTAKESCKEIQPARRYRHGGKFSDRYGFGCIVVGYGLTILLVGLGFCRVLDGLRWSGWILFGMGVCFDLLATVSVIIGCLPWNWWSCLHDGQNHSEYKEIHVVRYCNTKKDLTSPNYRNTIIAVGRLNLMANVLNADKQAAVIVALAEGSSIRAIERMTGVHRDTIMLDRKMRGLSCEHLQVDEIWGFIGKKERHVRPGDDPQYGDVWTFCAIDADTKLVPSFKVGKRDRATANAFVADVASRLRNRIQLSSDSLRSYVEAVELAFGADVDYAQIVKEYGQDDLISPERKYSPPEVLSMEKRRISGQPNMDLASTSYIERLNGTTRLHMRRLTRLTYAFSKKLENFQAAVGLHFAYYNFVKRHSTLRCTPAMEAGIERDFWTVGDLLEAAA
jgi:IS1 family transposase